MHDIMTTHLYYASFVHVKQLWNYTYIYVRLIFREELGLPVPSHFSSSVHCERKVLR